MSNARLPCRDIHWPVKSEARLTPQIEVVTQLCVKRTPSLASRSRFGVFTTGLPATPSVSWRQSSA